MPLALQQNRTLDDRLQADLADVEARFNRELLSDLSCVNALVGHIERYRGKMLRPTLVLASAAACRPDQPRTSQEHRILATVFEMVHMATLVHDDVLDDAQVRRRGATVNHLRGNEAAVMLGDYLISHAYHLCTSLNDPSISRAVAAATNTVCEGELLQLANRNNWQLDEATYFDVVTRKTASLCGACCELSAALCDADASTRHALSSYGEKLGVSFQIIDDLLDLTGRPETVGKSLGRDLAKGKLTLPLIRYLGTANPTQRQDMVALLDAVQAHEATDGDHDNGNGRDHPNRLTGQVRQRLMTSDALDYARQCAARLVESAKQRIERDLPPSDARQRLLAMASALLTRSA